MSHRLIGRRALRSAGRAMLALAGLLMGLLLLEAMTRLLNAQAVRRSEAETAALRAQYAAIFQLDASVGWRHRPGAVVDYAVDDSPQDYNSQVRVNSLGLHDVEYTREKPPGGFRILMLGDSFVDALQVAEEQSAQAVLESALNAGQTDIQVEVLNGGVTSYSTDLETLSYENYGRAYQPDLVILTFCLCNDVEELNRATTLPGVLGLDKRPGFFHLAEDGSLVWAPVTADLVETIPFTNISKTNAPSTAASWVARLDAALANRSALYGRIQPALINGPWTRALLYRLGLVGSPVPIIGLHAKDYTPPEYAESWAVAGALIRRLQADVEADGGRLAVLIAPGFYQVQPEKYETQFPGFDDWQQYHDLDKPDRQLTALLDEAGVPYLRLLPLMRAQADPARGVWGAYYLPLDGHWNVEGNRAVGQWLADWLRDGHMLEGQ